MQLVNYQKKLTLIAGMSAVLCSGILAQQADSTQVIPSGKTKEEGNRNVMLNASSANGPREISIGLPGGDVNVLENGLPVVYTSNPHHVNTHWRGDSSLGHVGLLKISETAITTGNIGYAVTSSTQLGSDETHGKVNFSATHFGKKQYDVNLSGAFGNDWFYSGSLYHNFDPGSFKLKFTPDWDRTQIYKAALTKRYNQRRGELSVIYHYSNSRNLNNVVTNAPFIYTGNGKVTEIPGFTLGTSSYLPVDNNMVYMDMRTGQMKQTSLYDASLNKGSQITVLHSYKWDNGLIWKINAKYDHALGSMVYQTPLSLTTVGASADAQSNRYYYYDPADLSGAKHYLSADDHVQSRMSCLNRGNIDEFMFTSELSRLSGNHDWRIGMNEWHYRIDYASNTTMYDQTVGEYPVRLLTDNRVYANPQASSVFNNGMYYDFNRNASEYYKGFENKFALYATDDWNITDKLNVYYGARFEYFKVKGENAAPYRDGSELEVGRFPGYHLGATYAFDAAGNLVTPAAGGNAIVPTRFDHDWLNMVYTLSATYKLTREFGFTGDFTYNSQYPGIVNFAPAKMPDTGKISIPLGRAGIYYNNKWISVTSLFSYISKTNNNSTLNLINPNNPADVKAAPLSYDIKTLGWTTDLITNPFKGFNLHFRFTYQNPTYKKYETGVTFSDGTVGEISATGNTVTEIPKVLIEIDPSYNLTDNLKVWASFRYFSKTYANIYNAYYFSGRWETFAGVNYKVNRNLSLNATVINFLNQTGASGSISGAELVTREAASQYYGSWMSGSYIRPFTVEFSVNVAF